MRGKPVKMVAVCSLITHKIQDVLNQMNKTKLMYRLSAMRTLSDRNLGDLNRLKQLKVITTSVIAILSAGMSQAHAEIYQTINDDGVTVFTDAPNSLPKGAAVARVETGPLSVIPRERTDVVNGNTAALLSMDYGVSVGRNHKDTQNQPNHVAGQRPNKAGVKQQQNNATVPSTYHMRLVSPIADTTYRRGNGSAVISVAVKPAVHKQHRMRLLLDGRVIGEGTAASYNTLTLDRGVHTASAEVVTQDGQVIAQAPSVSFFVHQRSVIIENKRKRALAAKQEKPWWKRLSLK